MDRPEYLDCISMARSYANRTQQNVIVYYDEDMQAWWYVTEVIWDMLLDNAQVEESWAFGDIRPSI